MNWAFEELEGIQLNDKRLEARSKKVLASLGERPSASTPNAFLSWAETHAAYRFIGNKKVTAQKVIAPHIEASIARIQGHKTVLMPQDTTELNYASHHKKQGIGPIHNEKSKGLLLHPTLAVTPDRICLGVVNDYSWYREKLERKKDHKEKPIEEKESYRWLLSYRVCNEIAKRCSETRIINIADREGDIYEFFLETSVEREGALAHWIVRSAQNRLLESGQENQQKKLWAKAKSGASVAEIEFEMPLRHGTGKRKVTQEIRFKRVKLKCPKTKAFAPVEVTVVVATEVHPPVDEKAVEWILLTSLDIKNAKEALEVVEFYLCRWQIEIFFRVLKHGCSLEKRQFLQEGNLNVVIRLYMIIAWRVLYLTMLGRSCPQMSCDKVFSASEWQSVYTILHKRKPLPTTPPSLNDMIIMIAELGGYIKNAKKPPGVQTFWIGLQRMHDFAAAWSSFQNVQGRST